MGKQNIKILTSRSGVVSENNFNCYYENLALYTKWDKIVSLGEEFLCRFCGEPDRKQFKSKNAHTFPEFTGNKWLFSKYECKDCNQKFSKYEEALANHGHLMRTLYGMKTKKKPHTKFRNNLMSLHRDKEGLVMTLDKKTKSDPEKDGEIIFNVDFTKDLIIQDVKIPEKEYIPLYLYKALCKIAFSIMPQEEILPGRFNNLCKLLSNLDFAFEDNVYQPYFYIFHSRIPFIERDPVLMLSKKHKKYAKYNMPTYSLLFGYGNHLFQVFLPYYKEDEWLLSEPELRLLIIPEMLIEKDGKADFTWMNGYTTKKTKYKDFEFTVNGTIN